MQGVPLGIELNEQLLQALGIKLCVEHLVIQGSVHAGLPRIFLCFFQGSEGGLRLIPIQVNLINLYARFAFLLWIRSVSFLMHRSRQQTKPWLG